MANLEGGSEVMSSSAIGSVACACLLLAACRQSASTEKAQADARTVATKAAAGVGDQRRACELITVDEASTIIGSRLAAKERPGGGTSSKCVFTPVDGGTQEFVLTVTWAGGREAWQAQEHATELGGRLMGGNRTGAANTVMKSEPAGLGDKSSYNPILGAYVLKDDVLLEFNNLLTLRDPRNAWERLARKVLARL
jgi:hypothetical protein